MMKGFSDIAIIDAHHHLWDLKANYYPWLTDCITKRVCGEYSSIRKNYLLENFQKDISEVNLIKSIHVQAECDDSIAETKWLQNIANQSTSKGIPHGIVAHADLSRENAREQLELQSSFQNVVGIRQMLHESQIEPGKPQPSNLANPIWLKNFWLLKEFELSFDLQLYYQQFEEAKKLLKDHPTTQFILCHTGQPARRDQEGITGWQKGMKALSEFENLAVKVSGLGMFDRDWTIESIRPFVLHTIDTFGTNRCMFGSNFPVDGMMSGYTRLWKTYYEIVRGFTDLEKEQMFSKNAEKIYLKRKSNVNL